MGVYHRYFVVIDTTVSQDVVNSFRQSFDRTGFSIGEVLLVNDLTLMRVLLICDVHLA